MRARLAWLLVALGAIFAPLLRLLQRKPAPANDAAQRLKDKVTELKAGRDAQKGVTDAAVAKVDASVAVDAARDPVALGNDLIRDAGKS